MTYHLRHHLITSGITSLRHRGIASGIASGITGITGIRALTSLNLSSNLLQAQGAIIVAGAIKVTKCTTAVVLVPFSCPSDHWWNCCCLLLSTG
jgi:hypothetical protein